MTITYKKTKNDASGEAYESINKFIDGTFYGSIPFDPMNTDYTEYLKWVAEGNTAEAAD